MKLNQSDKILASIKQFNGQNVYADVKKWKYISKLLVHKDNTNRDFFLGQKLVVEIDKIDGKTAHATPIRAPYSRYLWPGDSVEVTPAYFSSDGLAVADYNDTTVSKIHIIDTVPEETVSVKILKISNKMAVGEVEERVASGLKVGDELVATVESGTTIGKPENGMFEIRLKSKAKIEEKITIRITELDGHVGAKIIDPGALPVLGNEIDVMVERGSTQAIVPKPKYSVELLQPSLATGSITIEIVSCSDESEPTGRVISYNGLIPEVGQTVRAVSRANERTTNPKDGTYRIRLDETTPVATEIGVNICRIDDHVEGRIVDPGVLPRPGNKVEGQVKRGSTHAVITGPEYPVKLSQPSLLKGIVDIKIETPPNESDSTGKIVSYRGQLPDVRDTIQTMTRPGGNVALPESGTYKVILDETTPAAIEVDVQITNVAEQIRGEIIDYGKMPLIKKEISANAIMNKSVATVSNRYDIELESPSLASGSVAVKILSIPNSVHTGTVTGKIVSYGDSLPNVGEEIRVKVDGTNSVAKPVTGRYEIQLSEERERHGTGIVEITNVDGNVGGKIIEMDRKKSNSKVRNPFSSSRNSLISDKKL